MLQLGDAGGGEPGVGGKGPLCTIFITSYESIIIQNKIFKKQKTLFYTIFPPSFTVHPKHWYLGSYIYSSIEI